MKHANVNAEIIEHPKNIIAGILANTFVWNYKYLKSIANASLITCDEIVSVINSDYITIDNYYYLL